MLFSVKRNFTDNNLIFDLLKSGLFRSKRWNEYLHELEEIIFPIILSDKKDRNETSFCANVWQIMKRTSYDNEWLRKLRVAKY